MDALVRAAPPPGSAQTGDLYVDLQSRTLWLGVDRAVDPAEFVLISDILALQAEIDGAVVEGKAYTDAQISTCAPLVHTHTSSQITDLTAAVTSIVNAMPSVNWIAGMILQWKGSLAEIGVGGLAGWALCDGANGTPNLRDKFIIGAGNKLPGDVNPAASLTTTGGGTHIHSISATTLSVNEMPHHAHSGATTGRNAGHQHYVSGVTDAQGNHAHAMPGSNNDEGHTGGQYVETGTSGYWGDIATRAAGNHQHNWGAWTGGENVDHAHGIYGEGGGQPHNHTIIGGGGVHEHSVSSGQLRDTIPYYALAFIMKL